MAESLPEELLEGTSPNGEVNFLSLPPELVENILSYLSPENLFTLLLVCQDLRQILKEHKLWQRIYDDRKAWRGFNALMHRWLFEGKTTCLPQTLHTSNPESNGIVLFEKGIRICTSDNKTKLKPKNKKWLKMFSGGHYIHFTEVNFLPETQGFRFDDHPGQIGHLQGTTFGPNFEQGSYQYQLANFATFFTMANPKFILKEPQEHHPKVEQSARLFKHGDEQFTQAKAWFLPQEPAAAGPPNGKATKREDPICIGGSVRIVRLRQNLTQCYITEFSPLMFQNEPVGIKVSQMIKDLRDNQIIIHQSNIYEKDARESNTQIERELILDHSLGHRGGVWMEHVNERNPTTLIGHVQGPTDSPYAGGHFKVRITVPPSHRWGGPTCLKGGGCLGYPTQPAIFTFMTKIYHPNVDPYTGEIDPTQWAPQGGRLGFSGRLLQIRFLLRKPNICLEEPETRPINKKIINQMIHHPKSYEHVAKVWTQTYASEQVERPSYHRPY